MIELTGLRLRHHFRWFVDIVRNENRGQCKDSPLEVEISPEVLHEPGSRWPDDLGAVIDQRQPGLMPEMGGVEVGPLIIGLKGWTCFLCGLWCETGNRMSSIVEARGGVSRDSPLRVTSIFGSLPLVTNGNVGACALDGPRRSSNVVTNFVTFSATPRCCATILSTFSPFCTVPIPQLWFFSARIRSGLILLTRRFRRSLCISSGRSRASISPVVSEAQGTVCWERINTLVSHYLSHDP